MVDHLDVKIAQGICVSERGVDHCVRCVDTCEASHFKRAVEELKKIAEVGRDSDTPLD